MSHPEHEEDYQLGQQLANDILQAFRPGDRLRSVSRLSGGAIGRVFELDCERAPHRLVLKLFPESNPWGMPYEVFIFNLLRRKTSVPTPRIFHTDASHRVLSNDYVIMEKLAGAAIAHQPDLDESDYRSLYRQIGGVLRAMHGVTLPAFGYVARSDPVENWPTNAQFMSEWFGRQLEQYSQHGGEQELRRAITERVKASAEIFNACTQAVLCHTDIHESNVIAARDGQDWHITGVIDVGGAIAADPLYDVARTDYWSARRDQIKHAALLDGYGLTELDAHEEATLSIYRLYHALELRNWFATHDPASELLARTEADLASMLT